MTLATRTINITAIFDVSSDEDMPIDWKLGDLAWEKASKIASPADRAMTSGDK